MIDKVSRKVSGSLDKITLVDDNLSESAIDRVIDVTKFVVTVGSLCYIGYLSVSVLYGLLDSQLQKAAAAKAAKKALADRLKRPEVESMEFDSLEMKIMVDVLGPDEINVSFADIGGMDAEIEEVKDNVVLPFQIWKFYRGQETISTCPTGVLLYGAPGTGKSLTAKAIAKESGASFINIKASTLMNKWFGESNKLVAALFRLGRKLAPSVIFIDEIETLLKKRGDGMGNDALQSMQGVFLSEWDGLNSAVTPTSTEPPGIHESGRDKRQPPVLVLGATNRPMDLDKAFLRRMPVQIQTRVPSEAGRAAILAAQLSKEVLDSDVDMEELAARTDQFTGSDIRELVRVASLQRVKSYVLDAKQAVKMAADSGNTNAASAKSQTASLKTRPLSMADFEYALSKTTSSYVQSEDYAVQLQAEELQTRLNRMMNAVGSHTAIVQ